MTAWRTIPGIPTHEVSDDGQIRSKARSVTIRIGIKKHRRMLAAKPIALTYTERNGKPHYVTVTIRHTTLLVHRLVAMTFLADTWFAGAEVNHRNGLKQDNRIANLEWVTHQANELHSYRVLGKGKRKA